MTEHGSTSAEPRGHHTLRSLRLALTLHVFASFLVPWVDHSIGDVKPAVWQALLGIGSLIALAVGWVATSIIGCRLLLQRLTASRRAEHKASAAARALTGCACFVLAAVASTVISGVVMLLSGLAIEWF